MGKSGFMVKNMWISSVKTGGLLIFDGQIAINSYIVWRFAARLGRFTGRFQALSMYPGQLCAVQGRVLFVVSLDLMGTTMDDPNEYHGDIYIYMISIHKFTIAVLIFSDSPFWFVQKLVHISRSNLWIARPSPAKKGLESYSRAGFGGRVLAFSLPRSKSAAAWCDPRRGSSHDSECGDKF